jgi:hypothetical protein
MAGATLDAAGLLGIISAVLGDQIGFRPQLGGQIIQDIVPVAGQERTQQSVSSADELYTHTELAFADDDYRADYLALFCLRQDHEGVAATTLSSVETVLPLLARSTVEILAQPRFRTTVDQSFLRGIGSDAPIWVGPIRALTLDAGRPRIRADFAETAGTDDAAQEALSELREVAESAAIEVRLGPGDLLIIENNHAFHGRTPFRARWDGLDRWLLRTSIVGYLARSAAYRPGDTRVVDVDYSSLSARLRRAGWFHEEVARWGTQAQQNRWSPRATRACSWPPRGSPHSTRSGLPRLASSPATSSGSAGMVTSQACSGSARTACSSPTTPTCGTNASPSRTGRTGRS